MQESQERAGGGESFITRVAMWSASHRRLAAIAWLAVIVLSFGACAAFPVDTDVKEQPPGESGAALSLIEKRFATTNKSVNEFVVFEHPSLSVDDPAYRGTVEQLMAQLRALRRVSESTPSGTTVTSSRRIVANTLTHYDLDTPAGRSPLVSRTNPTVSFAVVEMEGDAIEAGENIQAVIDAVKAASTAHRDFQVLLGGAASTQKQGQDVTNGDFGRSLRLSLPLTFLLLLLAFRGLVAALIPLALAFVAIVVASGILSVVSQWYPLSDIYSEMVLLMGLATGIDYALFVITRFSRERRHGLDRVAAIHTATSTSGKAVAFAGVTVLLAIAGMFLVGDNTFTSLGLASMVVVALAVVVSITLLPALLGDALDRLRVPFMRQREEGGGFWGYVCDRVLARPAVFAVVVVVGLLALASPLLTLNLGFNGARGLPDAVEAKKALRALEQNFTLGLTSPAVVVVDAGENKNVFAPDVQSHVAQFERLVAAETVGPANPNAIFGTPIQKDTNDAGDTQVIQVPLNADTGDQRAIDAVEHLRADLIPGAFGDSSAHVLVTGASAANVDFKANIISKTPLVFGMVLGLAFIILLVTFRSIVIAVKAIILNLLSVGATYGVLVLVFQEGWLFEKPLSFEATGIVESWLPLFLFSILFGLSMDYHMFVMGRIKEAVEHGESTDEAISSGIKATAGTITNAALIMIAVALTFALSRNIGVKQFGFGLAVAILLDATIIRSVLLPASMKLLGKNNWYLPSWLRWIPTVRMAE